MEIWITVLGKSVFFNIIKINIKTIRTHKKNGQIKMKKKYFDLWIIFLFSYFSLNEK